MAKISKGALGTKLFIDSGDVTNTREALKVLAFLDGQTTNPSLVAKSPNVEECKKTGTCTESDVLEIYKKIVAEISEMIPAGSVSIEVYADSSTSKETMLDQARVMNKWIPNAHIKLPITSAGLQAANVLVGEGINVNMTLCFTQEQAAAVHAATKGATKGQVFVSPFMGRLDDRGVNGMDLIANCVRMYRSWNSNVLVLAASIRSVDHVLGSISVKSDIMTIPMKVLTSWNEQGLEAPQEGYVYSSKKGLTPIEYKELLETGWEEYNIKHELTDVGIEKFAADWRSLFTDK